MNRLSLLMWLAIAAAVIPLLAVPLWLMKTAVIVVALTMAGTTYSLIHQSESSSEPAQTARKHIAAGFHPQTVSAEANDTTDVKAQTQRSAEGDTKQQPEQEDTEQSPKDLTEDELKRQFFNTKGKAPKQSSDPVDQDGAGEHGLGQGEGDADDSQVEDAGSVNVTDPNSDRFIAVNTYKSRSERLRS